MRLKAFRADEFKTWLQERGAELVAPGRGEVVRFLTHEGVGCIYQSGSKDKLSFTGLGGSAYQAFIHEDPDWKAHPRPKDKRSERWLQWRLLSERDGAWCVFCGQALTFESFTIEHFLAKTHGGTNYYANLGLACEVCNKALGNIPVAQKIQFAIMRRLRNATQSKGPRSSLQGPSRGANLSGVHNLPLASLRGTEPGTVSPGDEGRAREAADAGEDQRSR